MEREPKLPNEPQIKSRDWRELSVVALPHFSPHTDLVKVVFDRHFKIYTLSTFKAALLGASQDPDGGRTIRYRSQTEHENIVLTDEQILSLLGNIARVEEEMRPIAAKAQVKNPSRFSQFKRSLSELIR